MKFYFYNDLQSIKSLENFQYESLKDHSPASNPMAIYLVIQSLLVKCFENIEIDKFAPIFRNVSAINATEQLKM